MNGILFVAQLSLGASTAEGEELRSDTKDA